MRLHPHFLHGPLIHCDIQHYTAVHIPNSAFSVKTLSLGVAYVGLPWRTWSRRPSRTHRSPRTFWPTRTTRPSWRKGRTGRRVTVQCVHMLASISGCRFKRAFLSITTTGRERTSRTSWKRWHSGTCGSSRTWRTAWTTWRGWRQGEHP